MGTQQLTSLYNYSIIGTYWGGGSRNDCVGTAAMTRCRRRHPAVKKNKPKKLPGLNAAHIYVENKKYTHLRPKRRQMRRLGPFSSSLPSSSLPVMYCLDYDLYIP